MATSIYIASSEARSGKSLAALGLMEVASRRVGHVGFFRPVIRRQDDALLELMQGRYGSGENPEARFSHACLHDEARKIAAEGRTDELLERILLRFHEVESRSDFTVCAGSDFTDLSAAFEFEFNARVAGHLGCPVLYVANGRGRAPERLLDAAIAGRRAFVEAGCAVVATLVNRVRPEDVESVREHLAREWTFQDPVFVVPELPTLGLPTLTELLKVLDGRLVHGDAKRLQANARHFVLGTMQIENVLERLQKGTVVITGGDRADLVLACMATVRSENYPNPAGIVLTGNLDLHPAVARLVDGMHQVDLPIISVGSDSYETARTIADLVPVIGCDDERKIAAALGHFEEHVPVTELEVRIEVTRSETMTPLRFEYELVERAKADRRHIVLPEGNDERILRAAEILTRRDVADLTILGDPGEVRALEARLGIHLEKVTIVDPRTSEWREEFAATYYDLRRHKGINEDVARDVVGDVSYFGTLMVRCGRADGMVSGAAHSTGHTIRPALELLRPKGGPSVVSSVFLMCLADRVLVYGDCAVNPRPTAEQLADIAISSSATAMLFGIEPRVAMLSYSTGESGSGEDVDKVREATRLVRERRPDLAVDGPIQYDAAVDVGVARAKLPESKVAGHATVFIFPDLNTGNNTYKAVQRSSGAVAIGPVLQGLAKPVNDLSRGCTVTDVVNTVVVTAIQANEARETV